MQMGYSITLTVGVILLAFSLYILKNSISFIKRNERAIATVINLEEVRDNDGVTYKPVFKFFTAEKKEIHFRYFASSSPPAWTIGEKATIAYDVNNPADAKLLTYFGAFGWSVILMGMAMPMLVIGGGFYLTKNILQ